MSGSVCQSVISAAYIVTIEVSLMASEAGGSVASGQGRGSTANAVTVPRTIARAMISAMLTKGHLLGILINFRILSILHTPFLVFEYGFALSLFLESITSFSLAFIKRKPTSVEVGFTIGSLLPK